MTTQQPTLDSREVAEMMEKRHKDLLRDIRNYIEIIGGDPSAKLRSLDFFIPSAYLDKQGQERPCYRLTKKGCDMIANKMTGEKGILFTATYVTRFEEMTQQLQQQFNPYAATRQTMGETSSFLREIRLIAKESGISLAQAIWFATKYLQAKGEPFPDELAELLLKQEESKALQSKQLTLFVCEDNMMGA